MSDAEVSAASKKLYDEAHTSGKSSSAGSSAGLTGAIASKGAAALGNAAYEFGTSPTAKETASAIAKKVYPTAAILSGAASGGALGGIPGAIEGAIVAVPAAVQKSWNVGRTAYRVTRAAQNVARPVASAIESAAPVLKAVSAASGAQSALDLAQMAEPSRKDIGTLGIGKSATPAEEDAMIVSAVHSMVQQGSTPAQAAAVLSGKDPRKFAAIMTVYAKAARQQDIELPAEQP